MRRRPTSGRQQRVEICSLDSTEYIPRTAATGRAMSRQFDTSPQNSTGRRPEGPKRTNSPTSLRNFDVAGLGSAALCRAPKKSHHHSTEQVLHYQLWALPFAGVVHLLEILIKSTRRYRPNDTGATDLRYTRSCNDSVLFRCSYWPQPVIVLIISIGH